MPPKQKATFSRRGKSSKPAADSWKRLVAISNYGGKSKTPAKRRRTVLPNPNIDDERVVIGGTIQLKNPTSFSERKRLRSSLSIKDILGKTSTKEEVPEDFAAEFGSGSMALFTWGAPIHQPVLAVRTERRHAGLRAFGLCRGRQSGFEKWTYGTRGVGKGQDTITSFKFMDLPLEIRWRIYGHVLIHPEPILVYSNWQNVQVGTRQDHTLLCASKQILLEATQFLYEKNVFHAVIQSIAPPELGGIIIEKKYLPCLRNVIVECEPEGRYYTRGGYNMVNAVAKCFLVLVESQCFLDSLTLIMYPTKGKPAVPLVDVTRPNGIFWVEPLPATSFAKYFEAPTSKIMKVITKLRCKTFNIILQLAEKKKVVVSIDLRGLPLNQDKTGWFAENIVGNRSWRKRTEQVRLDLVGLAERCQETFEDHEKAIMEGKARLMGDDEEIGDGMRLASRGQNGA